jgi:hypothetical protein
MLVEGSSVGRVAAGLFSNILVIKGSKTALRMAGDDTPDLMVSFLLPSEGHRGRMHVPLSPNEAERLAALHKLEILDTPSSPAIDRSVELHSGYSTSPWFM